MRFEDLAHAAVELCGDLMTGAATSLGEAAAQTECAMKGRLVTSIASSLQGREVLSAFEGQPADGAARCGLAGELEGVLEDDANMVAELLVALRYLPSQSDQQASTATSSA